MRKTKRFEIDKKEITVKELTPREIMRLGDELTAFVSVDGQPNEPGQPTGQTPPPSADVGSDVNHVGQLQGDAKPPEEKIGFDQIKKALEKNLTLAVEGVSVDEMLDMAPSDLKTIWDEFKGVNTVFFEVVQKVGMGALLHNIAQVIQRDFLNFVADFSKLGT